MKHTLHLALLLLSVYAPVFRAHGAEPERPAFSVSLMAFNSRLDDSAVLPTHRDDRIFLDGSAGEISLDDFSGISLSAAWTPRLSESLSLSAGASVLMGSGENVRKNANDPRPSRSSSYTYAEADIGFSADAALLWNLGPDFYLGPVVRIDAVSVEYGYLRFGKKEKYSEETAAGASAGLRAGWNISSSTAFEIEGTIGKIDSVRAGLTIKF